MAKTKTLDLEFFRKPLAWLDEDFGPLLTKAAVHCLVDQGHRSGIPIAVESDSNEGQWSVEWTTVIDPARSGTLPNENELTQKASECISLLLAPKLTGMEYFETAQIGTGVDFWLKEDPYSMKLDACLEVSGIRKETPQNTVAYRAKEKVEQARKLLDMEINVYISIVEFSTPKVNFQRL